MSKIFFCILLFHSDHSTYLPALPFHSTATIEVKLRNRGPDAFKPDKYGTAIIVTRKLRADGGGGYSLRNANST